MATTTKRIGRPPKHVAPCLGMICPDRIYTVEGLLRYAGIGRETLREARASGVVRPMWIGRRAYYRGAEVVEWIERNHRNTSNQQHQEHEPSDEENVEGDDVA